MRFILVVSFLLISFLGFGQTVSAPDPKSFLQSTNGQDASGFVLSGFSPTATLLTSISLVNPPTGTTFYLDRLDGLTPASGFTLTGNKTRLVFTGTMANINIVLANLKINTGSVRGNIQISVAATVNPVGFFYNGINGHFYRPVSSGTTYTNAKAASLNTSFKGQQGYLVTITSQSEQDFIVANVPQNNIWFALTDEVAEGQWRIDAGPEMGTLIKTSNGQTAGNIQGQYNNWCGGEPNNAGNEDYAVTKWGGGGCWNDLPNHFNNPYIIEYGTWTNPDDAVFTEFYTNSVSHSNGDVLRAQFNFEFGLNINETQFTTRLLAQSNNQYLPTTNVSRTLNGLGRVDMTSDLDTVKVAGNGFRATTTGGQVEWCVVYDYEPSNQRYQILIDKREFPAGVSPSSVTNLKLFDLWDGPVTYQWEDTFWAAYWINTPTQFNFAGSSFTSNIRRASFFWGLSAEFTFTQSQNFKPHGIELNTTNVTSLYNSIVTVSDVFLAFKELANNGLFGNETGLEFGSGIQFLNADVDENNVFDERDTYKLLQHLTGQDIIGGGSNDLSSYVKILPKAQYDQITKLNWNTVSNTTNNIYFPINLSTTTLLNTFTYGVFWKGDVNMSHSASQSISTSRLNQGSPIEAEMWTELKGGYVYGYINVNPITAKLSGVQFVLNYDNSILEFDSVEFKTIGNPINFSSNRGTYISLGSIINSGNGTLDNKTEYIIKFKTKSTIENSLGLISINSTDAVSSDGVQLPIKLK